MNTDTRIPGFLGRILNDRGVPMGTCFQVGPAVVVTAWHVLNDVGAGDTGRPVQLDPLAGGAAMAGVTAAVDPLRDLAVVHVPAGGLPAEVTALALTDAEPLASPVVITGVVELNDPTHEFRYLDALGHMAGGTTRDGQVQLGRVDAKAVMRGMSGGPVRRRGDDAVVGVVSARYNTADGWGRDSVWVARIEDLLPLLVGLTDPPIRPPWTGGRPNAIIEHAAKGEVPVGGPSKAHRVWMVPPAWTTVVPRDLLMQELVDKISARGVRHVALTAGVHGAGGVGKTTLAAELCRRPDISERFPGGILWVTIGESISSVELATKINDLSEVLGGQRPTLSEPEHAGALLGELLGDTARLLVIDDVWQRPQLRPFLIGGPHTVRLITTRIPGLLPDNSLTIEVDVMRPGEASEMLRVGLQEMADPLAQRLNRVTGRWPVLLALVNSSVRQMVRRGRSVEDAVTLVERRLTHVGPTALDVRRPEQRTEAVAATMAASLDLLTEDHLNRYLELAVFPEDELIPQAILELLWGRTGGMDPFGVEQLCLELAEMSLVQTYVHGPTGLRLHDIVRQYLRMRCGEQRLVEINCALLQASADLAGAETGAMVRWWQLPRQAAYLWQYLTYHLREAGEADSIHRLALDLRWIFAKTDVLGPVAAGSDLAPLTDPVARELHRVINRASHLVAADSSATGNGTILLSRMDGSQILSDVVAKYRATLTGHHLAVEWPLPDQPHPAQAMILPNTGGRVLALAADPEGNWLAGAGENSQIHIWNVASGTTRTVLGGEGSPIWTCTASRDGSWLASGGDDEVVRIWTLATGKQRTTLSGHRGPVRTSTVTPDGAWLITGGDDHTVRVWDVNADFAATAVLQGHTGRVRACTVSPRSRWLATAGDDKTVRVWSVADWSLIKTLHGHSQSVWSTLASEDDTWLASASEDRTVRIWDIDDGATKHTLDTHSGPVLAHGNAPDGAWLATGGDEGTVQIWDTATYTVRALLEGHVGRVRAYATGPAGMWLASGGDDQTVRIWEVAAASAPVAPTGHAGAVWTCASDAGGTTLITVGSDWEIRLWNVADGSSRTLRRVSQDAQWCAVLAPDAGWAATAGADGRIRIWDQVSGALLRELPGHPGPVWDLAVTPDGASLASAGQDGTIRVWDMSAGVAVSVLHGHHGAVRSCDFTAQGGIISAGEDGSIRHWDFSGDSRNVWHTSKSTTWAVAVPPTADFLITAGDDCNVRIHSFSTDDRPKVLTGHSEPVRGCAVSNDGSWIASVGRDRTLRVWERATGNCVSMIRVESRLNDCCWLPGTDLIAAVGDAGTYMFRFQRDRPPLTHRGEE